MASNSIHPNLVPKFSFNHFQTSSYMVGSFPAEILQVRVGFSNSRRKVPSYSCIKCEKKDKDEYQIEHVSVERPPYYSYLDSTSGQLEPASGARASVPEPDYWPEGTASQVRAARAPAPAGESSGSPSYGTKPGSRRKNYKASVASSSGAVVDSTDPDPSEASVESTEDLQDFSSDYVVYQSEPEEEETGYDLDKKLGLPHPFIDPKVKKPIEGTLPNEELWWNWQKPEKEQWSRWQRRKPDVATVCMHANDYGKCNYGVC